MGLRPTNRVVSLTGSDWLTLAETKAHLRVDWTEDDSYISALVEESMEYVQAYLGRPVRDATVVMTWGPVSCAPRMLTAPHLERGSTLDDLTVSVGGAGATTQAYKAQPLYDPDLREALIELDPPPADVGDESRAVFTGTFTVTSPAELEPMLRRARLLFIGEMFEKRMGEANLAAVEAIVAPFRVYG